MAERTTVGFQIPHDDTTDGSLSQVGDARLVYRSTSTWLFSISSLFASSFGHVSSGTLLLRLGSA